MNNLFKTSFMILFTCLFYTVANAQSKNVSGKVIEKKSKFGIPGASISTGEPLKTIGTTGKNGEFNVSVNVGSILVFKYIGYKDVVEQVTATTSDLVINLDEETNIMKEHVVVGYQQKTRETMTGSSVIISGKDIQNAPVGNVMELLQGRVAGLNIQNNVGSPGMRGSTVIRGISNVNVSGSGDNAFLTPTAPLFVIDGVPIDDNVNYQYGFEQSGPGVSPLSLIPTEDIEQIEVLKDAQATSLYGSKGAYGVILITTKRGKSKVPIISYTSNFYVSTPPTLRNVVGGKEERLMRINQIMQYDTSYYHGKNMVNETVFLSDSLNAYYNNATDWQSYFYRTTFNQTHNLNVAGVIIYSITR